MEIIQTSMHLLSFNNLIRWRKILYWYLWVITFMCMFNNEWIDGLIMSTFSLNSFDDDDFHGPMFQFMMNRMNAPRPRRGSRGEDGFR